MAESWIHVAARFRRPLPCRTDLSALFAIPYLKKKGGLTASQGNAASHQHALSVGNGV
jgi:hypothetical protein